ncbi:MAG: hypothetical protein K2H29_01030 [Oscillospiraceae bacterium]|nr:hypothetical protein [Oscillospiraceae bacterium]
MTRKETEQKCREMMQENIPDKEALWMKIESGLSQQQQSEIPARHAHISVVMMRRILTMAACLLLVFGGLRMYHNRENLQSEKSEIAENYGYDADANCDAVADDYEAAAPEESVKNSQEKAILRYQDLQILKNQEIRENADLSRLGVQDAYFNESDILSKTELFLDVQVLNGYQNQETGEMQYILKILDVYGGDLEISEFVMTSRSAYVLEKDHEYVIPVYQDSGNSGAQRNWSLVYECAPQIEKTQDHQIIFPNGWQSVMQSDPDAEPVLYDSYGKDDYFYDRMYLTGDTAIEILIQTWQKNL